MKVRTEVEPGQKGVNHGEAVRRAGRLTPTSGVKSGVVGDFSNVTLNHNEVLARGMKVRSGVKAGALCGCMQCMNHNEALARGMKVRSGVRGGTGVVQNGPIKNHNEVLARGMKVRSGVKGGSGVIQGGPIKNHNERLLPARWLTLRTGLRGGTQASDAPAKGIIQSIGR